MVKTRTATHFRAAPVRKRSNACRSIRLDGTHQYRNRKGAASPSRLRRLLHQVDFVFVLTLLAIPGCPSPSPGGSGQGSNNNANGGGTPQWQEAFDTSQAGFLSDAWGTAPDDVFIVGGQPERGEVYHFDGQSWSPMEIPQIPDLIWVYGFAPDDVYAVGEQGTAIHYDGQSWQIMETPDTTDLWGLWGASPNDIWAVGGELADGPPIILHFDGRAWTGQPLPPLDRNSTALLKVWGTSQDHVFAVGQEGLIVEFDGTSWAQVGSGTAEDLISIWGTGPDRIVAVGGRSNGVAAVYDGTSWTSQSVAPLPGLNGVFMISDDQAVVVGLIGTAATLNVDSLEFTLEDTPTALTLHGIWGNGAGTLYAVGGRSSELPYKGVALTRTLD